MKPSLYTYAERQAQLNDLVRSLEALVSFLPNAPKYSSSLDRFENYADAVRELKSNGYTQDDLNDISRSFPAILNLHPHWAAPFPANPNGHVEIPDWYIELDRLHRDCDESAEVLRTIGTY